MKTVKEVSKLTGVSVRALHHYDTIGLLKPSQVTEAGYRLYDDAALERLYMILVFRELGLPLKSIQSILDAPDYDRNRALEQQIGLMEQKITHLQNRMDFAKGIKLLGVRYMDFSAFDTKKLDEYAAQAKESWGKTDAYKEFEEKSKNWTEDTSKNIAKDMMSFFVEFGDLMRTGHTPDSAEAQEQVKKLQSYITANFYNCTPQILAGLGKMYACGGEFTENINKAGGEGCAEFAAKAISIFCR